MLGLNRYPLVVNFIWTIFLTAIAGGIGADNYAPGNLPLESASNYQWAKVTDSAAFPEGYNFPLFNLKNKLWAFHPDGNWSSEDGQSWAKADLPRLGFNTAYQKYVQFNDAIYALGTMEGNYLNLKLGSRITKTSDLKKWEVVAEKSELPARVFYGSVAFDGKMWLMGGFDGKNYYHDVWNSTDGVHWRRVVNQAPWAARCNPTCIVFNNKLWLLGGGVIDGPGFNDVWSSTDGINWKRATDKMAAKYIFGYSAVVYDGQLWLLGANRDGVFENAVFVSSDGVNWTNHTAPWTPRGGVASCVYNGALFMTGGKYSVTENGKIRFIYNNDVWRMSRLNQYRDR